MEHNKKKNNAKLAALVVYMFAVCVLTFADQIAKIAATGLKGTAGVSVIPGVFDFFYLENTGTAWGMFAGARIFFLILTCIILAAVTYIVIVMPFTAHYVPMYICMILLAAGGLGNFIDRLVLGYVRDFLYFKLIDFPVFNVADSYVTVGIIILIVLILFVYDEEDFTFIPLFKGKDDER